MNEKIFLMLVLFISLVLVLGYIYLKNLKSKNKEISELLTLFEISDMVLLRWVEDGNSNWYLTYISNNVKKVFGYSKDEFINKEIEFLNIIDIEDRNRIVDEIQLAIIEQKTFVKHQPFKIIRKDNKTIWVLGFDLITYENNSIHHVGYFYDITDIKQKDIIMYEQAKLASLGEMIGNIAHQWRQPLSVISTIATGMGFQAEIDMVDKDTIIDNCEKINKNAQYLSKTIDDFRSFIKGDRELKEFLINDLINEVLNIVNPIVKSDNIHLIIDNDEFKMKGYINELLQIIINLINNAKDIFNEKQQKERFVFLTIKEDNNNVVISVKDNGGGVPDDIKDKIFEPYFTTKHQSVGTGLGLSMSYKLVTEGMKGSIIEVNEEYEYNGTRYKGANFIITIPKEL